MQQHLSRVTPTAAKRMYINGTVRTMADDARSDPVPTAFAVTDGVFVAVGSDDDVRQYLGPDTEIVDLCRRTVLPGFIETHLHPHMLGTDMAVVDAGIRTSPSIDILLSALRERADNTDMDTAVIAAGFDDSLVAEDRGLTTADLDQVSIERPVIVRHLSGHGVYVNSFVLHEQSIDKTTPDPVGGVIVRDADGNPTGEFREIPAMNLVVRPDQTMPSVALLDDALRRALEAMSAVGVTSFHDMFVAPVMVNSYRRLLAANELTARARLYVGFGAATSAEASEENADLFDVPDDDMLTVGGVKIISDGSIQLHTGALTEPYSDLEDCTCGGMAIPEANLNEMVAHHHSRGRQVAIHTNGDLAIDRALDAIDNAATTGPETSRTLVHRLEHVQTLREDQIHRIARLGVAVSVFVNHVYYWGDRHHDRYLGHERGSRISPVASINRAAVPFALHCDSPVTPVDPLFTIDTAVNRLTRSGRVLGPTERVEPWVALSGYTSSAARLSGETAVKGRIAPGLFADFVILDDDPLTVDPTAIKSISVLATVVGGRVVHSSEFDPHSEASA
ncbi:amidohydrolase [Rhodococcus sp. NPDC056743]|uniref:amidohydrolase n=1 Tax=Rhodococcus sp. NPDC056743 TaxID=3345934 RepID=UPI00366C62D3